MTESPAAFAAMRDRAAERLPVVVRALLDARDEEVVIFGLHGDTVYLNAAAEASLPTGSPTPFAESRRFRAELAARGGRCIRFPVADVRVFSGRTSSGVRGIRLSGKGRSALAHGETRLRLRSSR